VSSEPYAPAALTQGKSFPGTHLIGDWMGPRAGLDASESQELEHNSARKTAGAVVVCLLVVSEQGRADRPLAKRKKKHGVKNGFTPSFPLYVFITCSFVCMLQYILVVGQDSSVGIATRNGLDGPEIESRWEARFSTPV